MDCSPSGDVMSVERFDKSIVGIAESIGERSHGAHSPTQAGSILFLSVVPHRGGNLIYSNQSSDLLMAENFSLQTWTSKALLGWYALLGKVFRWSTSWKTETFLPVDGTAI